MSSFARRWQRLWFSPLPLGDLAVCRILWTGAQLAHVLLGDTADVIARNPGVRTADHETLPILRLLSLPIGGVDALSGDRLRIVFVATAITGALSLLGLRTRWSLAAFAWGSLLLQSWVHSATGLSHHVALLQWSLVLLAFSPSGEVLSLDALLARRRARRSDRLSPASPGDRRAASPGNSRAASPGDRRAEAAWTLRLVHALLALAYLSAAASKVGRGPAEWFGGWTLQYAASFRAIRTMGEQGSWLGGHHTACVAIAWAVVVFEAGFFASFFWRKTAWMWAAAAILIHTGSALLMGVFFPSFPVLCAALVPWHDAWRRITRVRGSKHYRA